MRHRRLISRLTIGLASLVTLLALCVGVPAALAFMAGWPLPPSVPSLQGIGRALAQASLSDTALIKAIALVGWIAWLQLAVAIVIELVAWTKGRPSAHVKLAGPLQPAVRALIASAAFLLAGTRPAVAVPLRPTAAVATIQAVPTTVLAAPAIPASAPASAIPAKKTYTVVPGDTLWDVAGHRLGDPFRWPEIYELSRGEPQPDGGALTDPNLIRPGWVLELPDSPGVSSPEPAPPSPPAPSPAISQPAPAPPIPSVGPGHVETPAADTPTRPAPQPTPTSRAAVPSPATVAANGKALSAGDASILPATAPFLAGIAGATVLATGLGLHLRRLRRRRTLRGAQTRARPPSPEVRDTVRAVLVAADVALVRWAGQALAALGTRLDSRHTTSAPVAVEMSEATGIELLWDTPNPDAPTPWQAADGCWAWRLAYDPDAPVPADDLPAVIPGLVTIGERDGRQLLIDLEAFGSLAVTGDPAAAAAFMRAVVLELAADGELADTYVQTVGLDIDGVPLLGRITTDTFDTAVDRLTSTVASVEAALDASGTASTFEFRIGSAIQAHLELTAVAARVENAEEAAALVDVSPARRGVAAILFGDAPTAGAHVVLDADGNGHMEPLGLAFRAAGLPARTAAAIGTVFNAESSRAADTAEYPPAQSTIGDGQLAGDEPDAERRIPLGLSTNGNGAHAPDVPRPDPDGWRAPDPRLLVRVLGAPAIRDRPNLKRRELILAVYLACKARPVNTSSVQDALWNGKAVQSKTMWNLVGRTRSALGTLDDTTPVMPQADRLQNTLRLADGVLTDHALLRSLYEQALGVSSSEAIDLLRQGLELVEGPPFDAVGYDWAHHTEQYVADASALIERAAEHLIDLAVTNGDTDLAREAIVRGLRGLPGNEVLYRARMRLEHQAGNLAAVRNAYTELLSLLDDLDAEPSTETGELYGQLVHPGAR